MTTALLVMAICLPVTTQSKFKNKQVKLSGHVITRELAHAKDLGSTARTQTLRLAIPLKNRNEDQLAATIRRQEDPGDPLFGKYLSSTEFASQFGAQSDQKENVKNFLRDSGLKIEETDSTSSILHAVGSVAQIQSAFQVEIHQFQLADGRIAHATIREPTVDADVSQLIYGITGLNNIASHPVTQGGSVRRDLKSGRVTRAAQAPPTNYTPGQIQAAYGFDQLANTGAGQTVAFVEFDAYNANDITAYRNAFGITTAPTLKNILINGFDGLVPAGDDTGSLEVTIDIEMLLAVAPGLSSILVYEEANTFSSETTFEQAWLDMFDKIAADNLASVVSCSWADAESRLSSSTIQSENSILMRMAAQGQTIFASTGDNGSYDILGAAVKVNNPASQPYITSVGGTALTLDASSNYKSETSWGLPGNSPNLGGGGGISAIWPIPTWQVGLATAVNKGSATMRMIPDVSLNASNETCYSGYYNSEWDCFYGTSFATPIWAGFAALVNEKRQASGLANLGYLNPALYQVQSSSLGNSSFHDINDNSTNLFYPAVTGYDLSTGLGTLKADGLFTALTNSVLPPLAPSDLQVTAVTQ